MATQQTPQQRRKRETKRAARRQRTAKNWRRFIDWRAAGRKAYESKMRNLRAKGGTVTPAAKAAVKVKADTTEAAYVARLTAAITRTIRPTDDARIAALAGRDVGGGWRVLVTDGCRALLRKGDVDPEASKGFAKAEPQPFGLDITPALESALRGLLAAARHRNKASVRIAIDGRKRCAVLTVDKESRTVPVTGKLKGATLHAMARLLLDGFGRGGTLGYGGSNDRRPLEITTSDGLRYALMPVRS